MFDPNSPEFTPPLEPLSREGPEVMQAFVARHRALFILLAVLVGQLLLLSVQITRARNVRLIQVWAVAVFDPFDRCLGGLADAATGAWRTSRGLWQAQEENKQLNMQLVTARSQIQLLSEQAAEVERLRALLDFKNRLPYQTVAAEVIAASPGESSNAVFIDKGSTSGLTADLAVVTPAGVVGKIIVVFPYTAQVLLITDPSSGVGSMLERTRVQGVLKGGAQNFCQLNYIMNEESVSVGDNVLASGLDQIYPKGLVVGTVAEVREGSIYKRISVEPAAPLSRLETVLVILKPTTAQQQALNLNSRP